MKAGMATLYVATDPDGVKWTGDCARWAEGCRAAGLEVVATRVRWVGNSWPCPCCSRLRAAVAS